jgi:DNA-binding NarL/FixJ family response regulator
VTRPERTLKARGRRWVMTDQHYTIFRLVALGYTGDEIASEVKLSARTVETYRVQLMRQLGISKRRELVAIAIDAGIFEEA